MVLEVFNLLPRGVLAHPASVVERPNARLLIHDLNAGFDVLLAARFLEAHRRVDVARRVLRLARIRRCASTAAVLVFLALVHAV